MNLTLARVMKRPSAVLPMAMSLIALTLLVGHLGADLIEHGHVLRELDEGVVAHLWQLLMVGQLPILAFFAFKWLRKSPGQALQVIALQTGAVLANLAVVFVLGLG